MRAGVAMAPVSLQAPRCPGRSRCGLCEPATAEHGLSQKDLRSVTGTLVPRTAASAQPRPRLGRRHVPARRSQGSTAAARTPAAWGRPGRGPGPLSPWVLYRRGLCMNVRTCCCTCITTPDTRSTESWQRRESQNPAGERAVATRALCTNWGVPGGWSVILLSRGWALKGWALSSCVQEYTKPRAQPILCVLLMGKLRPRESLL